jgi:hypothetical protein
MRPCGWTICVILGCRKSASTPGAATPKSKNDSQSFLPLRSAQRAPSMSRHSRNSPHSHRNSCPPPVQREPPLAIMSRTSPVSRHTSWVSPRNLLVSRHNRPLSRHPHTASRTSSRRMAASIQAVAATGKEDSSPPRAARRVASRASRRVAQVVRPAAAGRRGRGS